mgnify:CR=1 FL=1
MRKMALDVGTVRIGIATSDPMGIIASGYETYTRTGNVERDMQYIAKLASDKGCDTFVIGLPLNMDGTEGEKVQEIRAFAKELSKYSPLKIAFQDERWSTVSAEKMLIQSSVRREKRKKVIDKVAATIILQTYLDKIN